MKEYPKFKYHPTEDAMIVRDQDQEKALGDEWKDSPAEFGVITHPSAEQQAEMAAAKKKIKVRQKAGE